ncbi:MAG: hypothetical protein H8E21_12030 [Gammaproteobacteria bacterium]|nr:hypothetical protein [Gammaproteobacteria bacterium]MBL6999511.1 hypothetical protein [Gammaproteobacteria bacterium]
MNFKLSLISALLITGAATMLEAREPVSIQLAQNMVTPLVSGQRVQVKKLTRDMTSVGEQIVTSGPSEFQDADVVKARQKRLQQFKDALLRYPQLDDPDVAAARAQFDQLQKQLSVEFQRAQQQLAKIGDAQQALKTIEQNSRSYPVPARMTLPYSQQQIMEWVETAAKARTAAEHNMEQLALLAEFAYLPINRGVPQGGAPYDSGDVKRMQSRAAASLELIDSRYKSMLSQLDSQMEQMQTDVFSRWQEDPLSDKKWLFLQPDSIAEAAQVFARSRAIVQSSLLLERALNRQPDLALAMLEKLDQAEQDFERKSREALASSRLPEARSSDPARLAIATQILLTPRYQFGESGTIVLTTDSIIEREKKSSEIDIDKLELSLSGELKASGTETSWTYRWKEFKFAVPLKEADGSWAIWWITAKNYSSGAANTPIGSWVSARAEKGNPIPRENF